MPLPSELLLLLLLSPGPGQTDYVRLWHIEEREGGGMRTEEGEWENGERLTAAASQPVH